MRTRRQTCDPPIICSFYPCYFQFPRHFPIGSFIFILNASVKQIFSNCTQVCVPPPQPIVSTAALDPPHFTPKGWLLHLQRLEPFPIWRCSAILTSCLARPMSTPGRAESNKHTYRVHSHCITYSYERRIFKQTLQITISTLQDLPSKTSNCLDGRNVSM